VPVIGTFRRSIGRGKCLLSGNYFTDISIRYREHIAHHAHRKSAQENAVDGRVTKPRLKARHYWSADELDSDSSEESEGEHEW
jgi:hypothetical protein